MKVPNLRWLIIVLIFLATLINYIDRLTISVLAPVITKELQLDNTQFALIATWFLIAYTCSQGVSGLIVDRLGTKRGQTLAVTIWSLAAMATAGARSVASLSICRFILGLGEAGNWPTAVKVSAEWFPIRERALALGIFNSGASLGGVFAPPIIVYLQLHYGWHATFLVTGGMGIIWLGLWLLFYEQPSRHPWLTDKERALIEQGQRLPGGTETLGVTPGQGDAAVPPASWLQLFRYREVWALTLCRVLCDPTWWLYLTWLPKYLSDVRGFSLAEIGLYAWVPYVAADAGSLLGGYTSGFLIARGWNVNAARRLIIVIAALIMPLGALAVRVDNAMVALVLMSAVLFGFQVWVNNVQVIPSDLFPKQWVGSIAGLGGFGAGIGSIAFTLGTGWMIDHFSYTLVFTIAGVLAPLATLTLYGLMGGGTGRVAPVRTAESVSMR